MEQELINRIAAANDEIEFCISKLREPAKVDVLGDVLPNRKLIWGQKVSLQFKAGVLWIEEQIKLDADKLMAVMAFETGYTFSPSVRNLAGSSGTGLIQFMAATARGLNTTTTALANMSAVRQLGYVYRYFKQFGSDFSDKTLSDIYMYVLFPKAVGKAENWPMPWTYGSLAYKQNAGLDLNKDHVITKAEAAAGVKAAFERGEQFRG